ncbi:unnamed protein product [Periconia digitata]|uniref:Uncharacterized protein n=1 Tax=Periconia digitata TaxID=1303443 RepID=A0A9W4UPH8_9PLEO|nr:unnamed protein product [Periconia digitata]
MCLHWLATSPSLLHPSPSASPTSYKGINNMYTLKTKLLTLVTYATTSARWLVFAAMSDLLLPPNDWERTLHQHWHH